MFVVKRCSDFEKAVFLIENQITKAERESLGFKGLSLPPVCFQSEKLADAFIYRYKRNLIKGQKKYKPKEGEVIWGP